MGNLDAVTAMVDAVLAKGGKPTEILIHPDDYRKLIGGDDSKMIRDIRGVPVKLDPETPRGQVLAVA